jgi:hypothetical protein
MLNLHDPGLMAKIFHLAQPKRCSKAETMANKSNLDKNIKDMTKQEIMRALADQGDKNVSSGKHPLPPQGDPLTWEFDGRTRELLDAFHATFKPEENLVADDVELFCICNGPDDGRPMIECSNGSICPLKWFHLDCIDMDIDELPGEQGLSASFPS